MVERSRAIPSHIMTRKHSPCAARKPLLPHPSRRYRLSFLLLTLATCFTCVTSQQGGPIKIIVSDELTECVPTNITWTGGTPPYTLGIGINNFDHGPDEEFSNLSRTFFVWSTDVQAEKSVVFAVGDSVTIAYSGFVDINAGLTQSCIAEITSTSGGASPTTKTQGAQASSGSPTGQPPSTSMSVTSTTVTVSVTDSVGGTNTATSSTSSSSHSTLSPDVIGIIVAVAVALLIVVIWVLYKRGSLTRSKPASTSTSTASPPLAPAGPAVAPYLRPPTSPTVRATSILSPSLNYSPVGSPPMSALQFAPYGYSPHPPPSSLPAPPPSLHPAWQGAAAATVHTTQTQTYFVGNPAALASRAPSVLSGHHEPSAGWNASAQETYVAETQWRQEGVAGPPPLEQGPRLLAIQDVGQGHGVASTEGGSDGSAWRDNALLARRP
ncbi:hypothetical protein V8D89_000423 [Ganoderma adspersum]